MSLFNVILILSLPMIIGFISPLWGAPAEEERVAKLIEGAKREGKLVWYTQMGATESLPVLKKNLRKNTPL